jgi:hypothetical protein
MAIALATSLCEVSPKSANALYLVLRNVARKAEKVTDANHRTNGAAARAG